MDSKLMDYPLVWRLERRFDDGDEADKLVPRQARRRLVLAPPYSRFSCLRQQFVVGHFFVLGD
jgi:hypothetical protein